MAMQKCPECSKKISQSAKACPNCGFPLLEQDTEQYKTAVENRRLRNQEINKKSVKLQLIWFAIFAVIIGVMIWINEGK